jgi:hypothetical protein
MRNLWSVSFFGLLFLIIASTAFASTPELEGPMSLSGQNVGGQCTASTELDFAKMTAPIVSAGDPTCPPSGTGTCTITSSVCAYCSLNGPSRWCSHYSCSNGKTYFCCAPCFGSCIR